MATRKDVFCIVCNLFRLVSFVSGPQIVHPYSRMGRVIVLYVFIIVSFVFPHCVPVRALCMFIVSCAECFVFFMCSLYVSFGSKVSPNILGCLFVLSNVLFMCRFKRVLYSAGSGVNNVVCVFELFSMSLFVVIQLAMELRYGWSMFCAIL